MGKKQQKRKKNRALPPRRTRLDRPRRLDSASEWLKSIRYSRPAGRRLVHRYAKWYRVDLICALKELELLEIPVDPAYAERLRETFSRPRRKKERPVELAVAEGHG